MNIRPFALRSLVVSFLAFLQSAAILAADAPLPLSLTFDLATGDTDATLFELMSDPEEGIKAALDGDYETPVTVVDQATFRERASNFAHLEELEAKIKGGAEGLDFVVAQLEGTEIPVNKMYGAVMDILRSNDLFVAADPKQQSRLAGALVPVIAIASGKGVLVQLDSETYCYNYGYAQGSGGTDIERDKLERKTGRSYGASASRNAYDPSDNDYLRELAEYASQADESELRRFYTVVFEILLKSDTSGIKDLNADGQTVIADFMAIYMAELVRHLMTGLKMYEWENALTEITMLAAYSASDSGATLDPRGGPSNENERGLVASNDLKPRDRLLGFFGVGTDGSGLDGRNKQRRHAITRKIVQEQRSINEELVTRIEQLIEARPGVDIYDEVMNRINSFKNQELIKTNRDELITALVDFVLATRASADRINML